MKSIWIVEELMDHEPSILLGVFSDADKAENAKKKFKKKFPDSVVDVYDVVVDEDYIDYSDGVREYKIKL